MICYFLLLFVRFLVNQIQGLSSSCNLRRRERCCIADLDLHLESRSDPPYNDYMQYMCGVFFVEMWTNDDEGFPMPEVRRLKDDEFLHGSCTLEIC